MIEPSTIPPSPPIPIIIHDTPFMVLAEYEQAWAFGMAENVFFGLHMSQHPQAVIKINQLLKSSSPARIIEIGVGNGGLTTLFALYAKLNEISLHAYDKTEGKHHRLLRLLGCNVMLKDALEDTAVVEEIRELVASPGRTIIFCDAGKAIEFNLYAPFMKEDDLILMHDFASSPEVFETEIKGKGVWGSLEVWYERVAETCEKHNIVHTTYFNDVVWSCGRKVTPERLKAFTEKESDK